MRHKKPRGDRGVFALTSVRAEGGKARSGCFLGQPLAHIRRSREQRAAPQKDNDECDARRQGGGEDERPPQTFPSRRERQKEPERKEEQRLRRIAQQRGELRAHRLHQRSRKRADGQEGEGECEQTQSFRAVAQDAAVLGEDAHERVRRTAR